jgi:hypothetical protein
MIAGFEPTNGRLIYRSWEAFTFIERQFLNSDEQQMKVEMRMEMVLNIDNELQLGPKTNPK